jgi:hypothetical protein
MCHLSLEISQRKSGRGDWIRTSDPLRPRQVRYQAALRPDIRDPQFYCEFQRLWWSLIRFRAKTAPELYQSPNPVPEFLRSRGP